MARIVENVDYRPRDGPLHAPSANSRRRCNGSRRTAFCLDGKSPSPTLGHGHVADGRAQARPLAREIAAIDARPRPRDDARSTPPRCTATAARERNRRRAIAGRRDGVICGEQGVSRTTQGRKSAIAACERSLRRLQHRPHRSLSAALAGSHSRSRRRSMRSSGCAPTARSRAGASRISTSTRMRELDCATREGRHCATNQVLYHLGERGIVNGIYCPGCASGACR